jgi:hypothetical protein
MFVKQIARKQLDEKRAGYLLSARSGRDPQGDGWSEDGGKAFRDAPYPFYYKLDLGDDMDISFLSFWIHDNHGQFRLFHYTIEIAGRWQGHGRHSCI